MTKEAANHKPSMQREWYCLAVQKYTRKRTFEYAGAEKQTAEEVDFVIFLSLSATWPTVCLSSEKQHWESTEPQSGQMAKMFIFFFFFFFFLIQNSWLA